MNVFIAKFNLSVKILIITIMITWFCSVRASAEFDFLPKIVEAARTEERPQQGRKTNCRREKPRRVERGKSGIFVSARQEEPHSPILRRKD